MAQLESGRFLGLTARRRQVGDLMLADVQYAAGVRLPRHAHERAYFCLIRHGTYTEQYCRRSRLCGPAMLVFHPPGEQHTQDFDDETVWSFNVELGPAWLSRMRDAGMPVDQPLERHGGEAAVLGHGLFQEFLNDDPDSALAIESLTVTILAALQPRGTVVASGRNPMPAWLREIPDRVEAYLPQPRSLRDVAAEAGVHPVHFAASFRRFYGCSFGEYMRRQRVEYARRQLARPDNTLAQIAADAGFADQSHLTRTFKRYTGLTPTEYRTFLPFKTR